MDAAARRECGLDGALVSGEFHWGYNWANEEAAIRFVPSGEGAEVAVAASRVLNGTVVLRWGEVQR